MSAISPHSNRFLSRSSKPGISLGNLSEVMMICLRDSYRELKVWKNSSWVLSLPAMNCTSSRINTSTLRKRLLNSSILSLLSEPISSFMKDSELR